MNKIYLSLISSLARMDNTLDGWCSAQHLLSEEFRKVRLDHTRINNYGILVEIPTDETAWTVLSILEKRPEIVWEIHGPYCRYHHMSMLLTHDCGHEKWGCPEKDCEYKTLVSGGDYLSMKDLRAKKDRAIALILTGRFSVQEPRPQNIPVYSDVGKEIRKGFYDEMADALLYAYEHRLLSPRDITQYGDLDMAAEALSKGKPVAFAAKPSIEDPLVATLVKARNLVEGEGGKIIVQYEPMKHVLPVTALKLAEELREKAKITSTGLATGEWGDLKRKFDLLKKFAEEFSVPVVTSTQRDRPADLDERSVRESQRALEDLAKFDLSFVTEPAEVRGDLVAFDTETAGYLPGLLPGRLVNLKSSPILQSTAADILGAATYRESSQELDERARIEAAKAVMLGTAPKGATAMDIAAQKQVSENLWPAWKNIRVKVERPTEDKARKDEFRREVLGQYPAEYFPKDWPFHMRQIPRDPEFRQKAKSCSFGDLRSTGVVIPGKNPITERVKAILGEKYSKEDYFAWLYGKPLPEPEEDKTIAHLQKKNEEMEKLLREKLHELEELGGANLLNKNALRMALNREAALKTKLKMLEESIEPKKGENA